MATIAMGLKGVTSSRPISSQLRSRHLQLAVIQESYCLPNPTSVVCVGAVFVLVPEL